MHSIIYTDIDGRHYRFYGGTWAWRNHNPTKKYEKMIRERTGIYDDRPIKKFTKDQFKKLWEAIEHFEGYKVGKIVEVNRIAGHF